MRNFLVIALPGIKSETGVPVMERLNSMYKITDFSAYDLLNEELEKGTELGQRLKVEMGGWPLSKENSLELLDAKLKAEPSHEGFLFELFIKNVSQAEALDQVLVNNNKGKVWMIFLKISVDLSARLIYEQTDDEIKNNPESYSEFSQRIRGIVQRKQKKIEALSQYYQKNNKLVTIDATLSIEEICTQIYEAVK